MKKISTGVLAILYCLCINAISLTGSVPTEGASNISISSKIILIFNESITRGTAECTLNESVLEPTVTGQYLIFTPSTMEYFTKYTLFIPEGAVTSSSGEAFAGLTLNFTTEPQPVPEGCDASVAADGSGTYSTIQEAINSAPSNSSDRYVIYIYSGDYSENITIPEEKQNITLWGEHLSHVILHQENIGTPTVNIKGDGCYLFNMSIRNESSEETATALNLSGDKNIIRYCEISGKDKTLATGYGSSYLYQCYIKGQADLIEADGTTAMFDHCIMETESTGIIAAASTPDTSSYGLVFKQSRIVSRASGVLLGKALNATSSISYNECELPSALAGDYWNIGNFTGANFSEYMNFGPGAETQDSTIYLTTEAAEEYTVSNIFKGWDPLSTLANTGKNAATWIEGDGLGVNRGGNGGTEVTVSTVSGLSKYISSNDRYIIKIKGTLSFDALYVGSNTTITGVDESSTVIGNFRINDTVSNVIIKQLNITHPGELKANDGISMEGCHRILVDHVSFYDCSDGVCDMRNGTDSVTLRWNKIYYVDQTDGHRFTMIADGVLIRDDDSNVIGYGNPFHVTFHHNWWSTLCHERMPSSTNTMAHLYNCYWNCNGNYYCSLARTNSEFYSENNYYANVQNPIYKGSYESKIYTSGNIYSSCTGTTAPGTDQLDEPDYEYIAGAAKDVPEIVSARAGNYWTDPDYIPTGNNSVSTSGRKKSLITSTENGFAIELPEEAGIVNVSIYNLSGQCLYKNTYTNTKTIITEGNMPKGVYIIKTAVNGKKEIVKAMIK